MGPGGETGGPVRREREGNTWVGDFITVFAGGQLGRLSRIVWFK